MSICSAWFGLLLVPFSSVAFGQSLGSVLRVEGPVITVNSGERDRIQPGQTLYVSRMGQAIAQIKVEAVGEFSSRARLVASSSSGSILAGDQVQAQPASGSSATVISTLPGLAAIGLAARPAAIVPALSPALAMSTQEAEQNYRDRFNSRTKKHSFKQVEPAGRSLNAMMPGNDAMNIYMAADSLASNFGPGGFYGDPGMLLLSAGMAFNAKQQRDQMFSTVEAKVEIEATYWDLPLMERYCQYVAVTSGQTSGSAYQTLRNNLVAQKGVENGEVFEVRIRNKGKTKVQLSPFHWHMFLSGPNNSRVAATRYDQVLDRSLDPGEEVAGNVYFQKLPTLGDSLVVFYEDIYGDKGSEKFPLPRQPLASMPLNRRSRYLQRV